MSGTEFDPGFRERHAFLANGYGGHPDPSDPADILTMQMVLHIPKNRPVDGYALLSAAASAVVQLCLDARVGEGGPWQDDFAAWMRGRIRKVSRRARGSQWTALEAVPGVTVAVRGELARAFVPGRVGAVHPLIKRLQIGGTDVPFDGPACVDSGVPVLWLDPRLGMTLGKSAAQVGHASMLLAAALPVEDVRQWRDDEFAVSVANAEPGQWGRLSRAVDAGSAVAVHDAGFTEVEAGARTVIASPGLTGARPRAARVSPQNVGEDGNRAAEQS